MFDFKSRSYHDGHHNPVVFSRTKTDDEYWIKDHKANSSEMELRTFEYKSGGKCEPTEQPIRTKSVRTPMNWGDYVTCYVDGEGGTAKKVITRNQIGTNNQTKIAFDYLSDEAAKSANSRARERAKVVEIKRDLKSGEVLEFKTKTNAANEVILEKIKLQSGKTIENIPEFFNQLKKELDPLARNLLKKALSHMM